MAPILEFEGFPAAGFKVLQELSENNNKSWFEANKQRYIEHVQTPAVALVHTLGERLQDRFPGIQFDTAINGSGSLLRPYRDTRFSKDKTPYKTNVAMMFWDGKGKKMQSPGFGLQISLEATGLMTGMHNFDKDWLNAYREAVLDAKSGRELVDIVAKIRAREGYEIGGQHYKNPPRGITPPEDERAPLLLHNALYAYSPEIPRDVVMNTEFIDVVMGHYEAIAPIQQWLVKIRQ